MKIDNIVDTILRLGRGTQLAKMDIKSAFRIVPVHPDDRHLLGIMWGDRIYIYIDATLPFGLRSAPNFFNALADALEWIMQHQGAENVWHYLDDFLVAGSPHTEECMFFLQTILYFCLVLGIPIADEKVGGPAAKLAILGIQFNTYQLLLRFPQDKLDRIIRLLSEWTGKKRCTKKELQSFIGTLLP